MGEMGTVPVKDPEHLPSPLYPPESKYITLVLHYGGQFVSKPIADYIGGDKVVYDYLDIVDVSIANLSRWCEDLGVTGEKNFYGIFKNGFKWLWDDYQLNEWARGCESTWQVHVCVEGDVQKGSDQSSHVDKASEAFEVQKSSGEDREKLGGSDEGEMAEDFDDTADSDDEEEVIFEVGMVFETKDEFKKAIQTHAIQTKRSLHTAKNDKIRVYVRCRGDGCEWGINLCKRVNESKFQIIKYNPTHECAPTVSISNLNSQWLAERYVLAFQNNPRRKMEGLRKYIMRELKVNVSRQQAYGAKRKALKIIEGLPDEQYSKLRDCVRKLKAGRCSKKMSSSCSERKKCETEISQEKGEDVEREKCETEIGREKGEDVEREKCETEIGREKGEDVELRRESWVEDPASF